MSEQRKDPFHEWAMLAIGEVALRDQQAAKELAAKFRALAAAQAPSAPVAPQDERTSFEKEMNARRFFPAELDFSMTKSPSGKRDEYVNTHLESCWNGWTARAALFAKVGSYPEIPDGWKLVPKEPTAAMMDGAFDNISLSDAHSTYGVTEHVWDFMLAAAPTPPRSTAPSTFAQRASSVPSILVVNEEGNELGIEQRTDGKWQFVSTTFDGQRPKFNHFASAPDTKK